MGDDFRDTFMGSNVNNSAEDHLNNNFGINDDASNSFDSFSSGEDGGMQDEFTSRFSNQQSDNGFYDSFGGDNQGNSGYKKERFGGLFSGIIGTIIASKLFSIIDKNGSISNILGINKPQNGQGQPQQGQPQQGQVQQGQQRQGRGLIGNALSVVGILVGIGIILFFAFYVLSFFLHGNLGPNGRNGATESADLSPWVQRLSGKRNNNLVVIANSNKKDIVPYRYSKEDGLVHIYLDTGEVTLQYDKDEWKSKYDIDKIDKFGYMAIGATQQPDGTIVNVQPIGVYDGKTLINAEDESKYISEEGLKGLGLSKIEYEKLKIAKSKGIKGSLFLTDKERKDNKRNMNSSNQEYMDTLPQMNEEGEIIVKPSGKKQETRTDQGMSANDILERNKNQQVPSNYENSSVQNSEGAQPSEYFQESRSGGVKPQQYFQEGNKKKEIIVKPAENSDNMERMRKNAEEYQKMEEVREYRDKTRKEIEENKDNIEEGKEFLEEQQQTNESDGTNQLISKYGRK